MNTNIQVNYTGPNKLEHHILLPNDSDESALLIAVSTDSQYIERVLRSDLYESKLVIRGIDLKKIEFWFGLIVDDGCKDVFC